MSILLLRLMGPMQSWGTTSRFTERDTGREPSKSGVIGLLCAALGRARSESIDDLTRLRMGVRIDQEGLLMNDYHTASNVYIAKGGLKDTCVSNRYYLSDASFLVALEGPHGLLSKINTALRHPRWQIYLGRKSFLPSVPVWVSDELIDGQSIEQVFGYYPGLRYSKRGLFDGMGEDGSVRLRHVIDSEYEDRSGIRRDVPLSFETRTFTVRYIRTGQAVLPHDNVQEVTQCFSHV